MAERGKTLKRTTTTLAVLSLALAAAAPASAHPVEAQVTSKGLAFVADTATGLIPERTELDTVEKDLPGCLSAKQRDTELVVDNFDVAVTLPGDGHLEVVVDITARADGYLTIDGAVACLGALSCSDSVSIDNGRIVLDFLMAEKDGRPSLSLADIDLQISSSDLDIHICDGFVGTVASGAIGFLEKWFLGTILNFAEGKIASQVSAKLEEALVDFSQFDTAFKGYKVALELSNISATESALGAAVKVDLTSDYPLAACIKDDPGEPSSAGGSAPAVSEQFALGVSVGFGLIDDALYHVWRRGLTCVSDHTLEEFGVELHLDHELGAMLPGFPSGSSFRMLGRLNQPPRVVGVEGDNLGVKLVVTGAQVSIIGTRPDGTVGELDAYIDIEAVAEARVDPVANGIALLPKDVYITDMRIDDELGATDTGFDVAALRNSVQNYMVPALFADLGEVVVAGSAFGQGDYHVIARQLSSNDGFLSVAADLFKAPDGDIRPPLTELVSGPGALTNPHDAVFVVGGSDAEIPPELLRFRVTVDGDEQPLTFVRQFKVGEVGVTGTHQIEVRAVDLAYNVSPSVVRAEVVVDGILPSLFVRGGRNRAVPQGELELDWEMSDDYSDASALRTRIDLYRLVDPKSPLSTELVESVEVERGVTTGVIDLRGGGLFRAEVVVTDEAGNETVSSVLLRVDGGGCQVGSGAGSSPGLMPLLLGLFALVFRRRIPAVR